MPSSLRPVCCAEQPRPHHVHARCSSPRDPYVLTSKEFEGSTIFVEEVRKQAEDAPAQEVTPSPRARSQPVREPSQSAKSATPPVAVTSKGKGVVVQAPKNPNKKRKLVKPLEVEAKRKKLMSSAMLSTPLIEVATESSPTFASEPLDLQPTVETEREDFGEVEEQDEVDLPLTVLPPLGPVS